MKHTRKIMALVMALVLCLGMLPATANAAGEGYLTFSSDESFTLATKNGAKDWNGTLEYSTDASTWATWDGTTTLNSGAGNALYLRGTGNAVITGILGNGQWVLTGSSIACSGNIMTLLDYEDPDGAAIGYNCFANLFRDCRSLVSAPELPATTLALSCYQSMFDGCTSLVSAPELPATTLASNCYNNMFRGCTSLVSAPELPATTLAGHCYQEMFDGCRSLTSAPALPATELAANCYNGMFRGCTSLTTAPALPATTLADYCYNGMFNSCRALTTAPELPATELAIGCYWGMFQGCRALKLSATQTDEYTTAYRVPMAGEGTDADDALEDMFANTGGTFKSTPTINTTYYLSNTNTIVYPPEDFTYAPVAGTSTSFQQALVLRESANVPTASVAYSIDAGLAVPYTAGSAVAVYAGVGEPTVSSVSYAPGHATVTSATGVTIGEGKKAALETATVDFSGVSFAEPGIYRYIITMTSENEQGMSYDTQRQQNACVRTQRVLDVYVTDDGTGTLAVSSYVLHELVGGVNAGTEYGSEQVSAGGRLGDKSEGFVNEYATYDVAFSKTVAGNQASRDKYFKFTVSITNAGDTVDLGVDLTNAAANPTANAATVYTADQMAANNADDNAEVDGNQWRTDASGAVEKIVYLQHGQSIVVSGLAEDANVTITETPEDYKSNRTGNAISLTEIDADSLDNAFINTRNGVIPTGVMLSAAPGIVILSASCFFLFLLLKRRKEEEEEAEA